MKFRSELWIVAGLLGCAARDASSLATEEISLFAAASLAPVIEGITRTRPIESPRILLNAAASSTLAHQIDMGAGADLFLSAHLEWITWLDDRGLLDSDSIRDVAANQLVWVVPADSASTTPFELEKGFQLARSFRGRLAIGDPSHVPVGRYARQALERLAQWNEFEDRLAPALDARAALRLVELGEAGAGIVYASDALNSDRVVIRAHFSPELSDPIRYRAAAVRGASEAAYEFLDELTSSASARVFKSGGFLPSAP